MNILFTRGPGSELLFTSTQRHKICAIFLQSFPFSGVRKVDVTKKKTKEK